MMMMMMMILIYLRSSRSDNYKRTEAPTSKSGPKKALVKK